MKNFVFILAVGLAVRSTPVWAQAADDPLNPQPAFAGQTKAPVAKPSPAFNITTITGRLNAPWTVAFLPDGNFLITAPCTY